MSWIWTTITLCAVSVTLKLTGLLTWSWWWVLAPLWVPWFAFGISIVVILSALLVAMIREYLS